MEQVVKQVDVVKEAARVMKQLMEPREFVRNGKTLKENKLTTSQIRKFLIAVNTVTNKINVYKSKHLGQKLLSDELAAEVQYLKVKIVYQAGRENTVRKFVDASHILDYVDAVGNDIATYDTLSRYVEALVAYHKFYGGKD